MGKEGLSAGEANGAGDEAEAVWSLEMVPPVYDLYGLELKAPPKY